MRARLHLLHALTRSGLPPLLKTTEATEISTETLP
jgi:hypothetical protein